LVLLLSCSDIFVLCHICQRMQQRYILGNLPSFDALQEVQQYHAGLFIVENPHQSWYHS
jgi:hypothetical protein